jgi:hypothetical protein
MLNNATWYFGRFEILNPISTLRDISALVRPLQHALPCGQDAEWIPEPVLILWGREMSTSVLEKDG